MNHNNKIYNFLLEHAFKLDRNEFKNALDSIRRNFENYDYEERQKDGWLFKKLLEKLGRYVNWHTANDLEIIFVESLDHV